VDIVNNHVLLLFLLGSMRLLLLRACARRFCSFGEQFAVAGSSYTSHDIINDKVAIRARVCRFCFWSVRIKILSQPSAHAETKVGRAPLATARSSTTAAVVIDVHGIITTKKPPLSCCLLVASLYGRLESSLLLATHFLPVDSFLFDLLHLRFEICKGRVAAL
jgi:hypothetical protein